MPRLTEEFSKSNVGKRFNRLVVISDVIYRKIGQQNRPLYLCKCDCGNKKEILWDSLRSKKVMSCGCYRREECTKQLKSQAKPKGVAAFNSTYKGYKLNAKNRGLIFELSKEEFKEISQQNCHYCGDPPSNLAKGWLEGSDFRYNGVDRVDSNLGYIKGNMVPCCGQCNWMKNKFSIEDFDSKIIKIYHHYILNKESGK